MATEVAAGVSELGPAMSDGESGFAANYTQAKSVRADNNPGL
jgi:hypothetical protein